MEYYDEVAQGYDELHEEEQLKKLRLINDYLKVEKGEALLDVGCGTGLSTIIFKCNILGLDPARRILQEGRKRVSNNPDFIQGLAECLPFKDKRFGIVLCVTAIHNFERPEEALEEMKRVCKGRGAITILKKAKTARELEDLIYEKFSVEKVVEEEKDKLFFFRLSP